jgi:hypothetical protein
VTTDLSTALRDLAAETGTAVRGDRLAAAAWRRGRRRRRRRHIVTAAVTAGLITAALPWGLAVSTSPRHVSAGAADVAVHDYPDRIGHQWFINDLPERPGPLAGLIRVDSPDNESGWQALAPDGTRWRLPVPPLRDDVHPTLSPDGRYLGYPTADQGPFVLRNVVTGERTEFPSVGVDYALRGQHPAYWTPDGTRVLLPAVTGPGDDTGAVVLGVDGSLTPLPAVTGHVIGWTPRGLAWLGRDRDTGRVSVHVMSEAGIEILRVDLRPSLDWGDAVLGRWAGAVSPDGTRVVVVVDDGADRRARVRWFTMPDGAEEWSSTLSAGSAPACGLGWTGPWLLVPARPGRGEVGTLYVDTVMERWLVAVEPGLGSRCVIWASDAVTGGLANGWPSDGDLMLAQRLSDDGLSWWWRETLLVVAVVLAIVMVVIVRRRRRELRRGIADLTAEPWRAVSSRA